LKNKIVIIDYNSGNIKSLRNMLSYLGCDYILSSNKKEILSANKLLFPGQGQFAQAMENLE
jgi:glutamine amidotransferase